VGRTLLSDAFEVGFGLVALEAKELKAKAKAK
jgi:hypothetical protein